MSRNPTPRSSNPQPPARDSSERRFRELANSLPQTVFEMDLAGNLTFANTAAFGVWQVTDEEVRAGLNIFDWIEPECHESARANMARVLRGENVGGEYRAHRKDGTVFPIVVHARPILRDGIAVGLRGLVIDLSAQKQAEQALRESEQRFRDMADALPETIFEMDTRGRLTFINRSAFDRWGYTPEDLARGLQGLELLAPDDRVEAGALVARALAGEQVSSEYSALRKNGGRFPVLVRMGPIVREAIAVGVRAVLVDVSDRKRAEDARARSEWRFRSLVKNAVFGIYRSTLDGRFVEVNPALVSMLGYSSERELLSVPVFSLYGDARDRRILVQRFIKAEHVSDVEVHWRKKDGTPIIVRLNGRWVSGDGLPEGFEMIVEDVSDERALEDQLHQAQKMDAIGRLAGGVAHDFNNLLTAILGYTDLLLEQLDSDDPRRSDATEIHKAAERAASLTRQLLAFSRKQVLQPQPVDLGAITANLEPMLRRLINENIELRIEAGEGRARVKADPGQIEQVVVNLAVNARDAMPRGGTLTIVTASVELDAASARQHAAAPGPHVLLEVRDDGCGMTGQVKAHMFEPFFTTKDYGKGTGLGLATVYGIVRQSGGHILVESEVNRGTTVRIFFPAVEEEAADARAARAVADAHRGSGTVLLVEDEPAVGRLASELLKRQGYTVLHASSGEHALALARDHHAAIDLLLTDIVMPGMSGRELMKQVATTRPGIKVLYMSGYTEQSIVTEDGVKETGVAFLQKPFTRESLMQAVKGAIQGSE